ncbi:putative quinol monooxygenase [Micromonospora sp. NPDC023633]|uniref:putative quinol monooxygenase n=1 Tax=Micromonospora sp. NPDC023633 TaxID=3154320 RepID=UPI0033F6DA66
MTTAMTQQPNSAPGIRVIAEAHARDGALEQLLAQAKLLIAPTRAEPGNISYEILHDLDDPNHLVFVEHWQSQAHFDAHLASEHLAAYSQVTSPLLAGKVRIVTARTLTP